MKNNSKLIPYIVLAVFFVMSAKDAEAYSSDPKAEEYVIEKSYSVLKWKGTKPGGAHEGEVELLSGTLVTNGNSVIEGSFIIDMNSITSTDLEGESSQERLVNHLKDEDFFYSEKYPRAFFTIKNAEVTNENIDGFNATHIISGDLTMRGVTNQIEFPANIAFGNNTISAKTPVIVLDRTEWGVMYNSKKLLDKLKDNYIDDEIEIMLEIRFRLN